MSPNSAHLETLHFFGGIDGNTSLPAFAIHALMQSSLFQPLAIILNSVTQVI